MAAFDGYPAIHLKTVSVVSWQQSWRSVSTKNQHTLGGAWGNTCFFCLKFRATLITVLFTVYLRLLITDLVGLAFSCTMESQATPLLVTGTV
jgi:hypothetical protein